MKNISLGQYYPSNSIIHKLDGRTKIILATIYIITNDPNKAMETYDRLIDCLKNEWGYKDDDAAVIDAERKKKALISLQ